MATSSASNDKSKSAGDTADIENLEAQIAQLRGDLAALADTIGGIGKSKAEALKGKAAESADEASAAAREALDTLNARASEFEGDIAARIRERPFMALGLAAGLGFVAALIARR